MLVLISTDLTYSKASIIGFKSSGKENFLEGLYILDLFYIQVTKVHQVAVVALPEGYTVLLGRTTHKVAFRHKNIVFSDNTTTMDVHA